MLVDNKICFRLEIHQIIHFRKLLNYFIIISIGIDRKGCLVYNMPLSNIGYIISMITNEAPNPFMMQRALQQRVAVQSM